MTRLTMLFIAVALVLPGAAMAMPDRDPGTVAALGKHADPAAVYYASYRDTESLPAPAPEPVATGTDGLSWTLAIGGGIALMLIAGGLGVYAGRTIHPRHIGA
jgi:hypothetical protein